MRHAMTTLEAFFLRQAWCTFDAYRWITFNDKAFKDTQLMLKKTKSSALQLLQNELY